MKTIDFENCLINAEAVDMVFIDDCNVQINSNYSIYTSNFKTKEDALKAFNDIKTFLKGIR